MNKEPCEQWQPMLVSTYPDDLTYEQRLDLETHLLVCSTCRALWYEDRIIDDLLRRHLRAKMQDVEDHPLPPQLLRLWQWREC